MATKAARATKARAVLKAVEEVLAAVSQANVELDSDDLAGSSGEEDELTLTTNKTAKRINVADKDKVTGSPRKRRCCRYPGCKNVIKSQGHCQKHGAQAKRCKANKCSNQAQGSHNGYCKRHWRQFAAPPEQRLSPRPPKNEIPKLEPSGNSVYDEVIPASFMWTQTKYETQAEVKKVRRRVEPMNIEKMKGNGGNKKEMRKNVNDLVGAPKKETEASKKVKEDDYDGTTEESNLIRTEIVDGQESIKIMPEIGERREEDVEEQADENIKKVGEDKAKKKAGRPNTYEVILSNLLKSNMMPIAQFLADNTHLEYGWHRNRERIARGIYPPKTPSAQLEPWEKQLVIIEISLLAGTDSSCVKLGRCFGNLAHAWGREKGFHKMMLEQLSFRRGDLDRKRRYWSGRSNENDETEAGDGSDERKYLEKHKLDADEEARKAVVLLTEETELSDNGRGETATVRANFNPSSSSSPNVDAPPIESPSIEEMVEFSMPASL